MRRVLGRRAVLRGAGVSLALPWLEAMTPLGRRAQAASPKRFVVFFTPNGYIRDAWVPTGTETAFTLGRTLAPLDPFKNDIVVLDGVDNVAATKGPGDDHQKGMGTLLTGIELLPGKTSGGCATCPPAGYASGPSVDQEIVQRTNPGTKFPSLEFGVQCGSAGTNWGYANYKASNQPLPPDNNPKSVFDRIFTDLAVAGGDNTAVLRLRNDRRSVLDAVMKSYKSLNPKLGSADRAKLDAHLTAIGELQKRLAVVTPPATGTGCIRPATPAATLDARANDNFPMVGQLQMDQLAMSLACDLARVATIQWTHSVGQVRFTWLGLTRGHHDMSHDPDTNLDTKEGLTRINEWYAKQFAYLLGKLKTIPDGTGTLLDSTMILWCNELSRGNAHSHPDMPYVLAGRAGGALRTGRWLKYGANVSHNNLLVSCLNAMGVPATTFGNPAYCTGPLAGLL